jgi:hypothetical protein
MHGAAVSLSVLSHRVHRFLESLGVAVEPAEWLLVYVDGVLGRLPKDVQADGLLEESA